MNGRFLMYGEHGFSPFDVNLANGYSTPSLGDTDCYLVPGLVDVHIHGAFGVDFFSAPPERLVDVFDQLESKGYEALLATTVTASVQTVLAFLDRLPNHRIVQGFHLEGPFISPKHPGAQPPSAIASVPVGESDWDAVWDDPRLRLVTLAPELENASSLVLRLANRGVIVSMGHTDATFAEVGKAVDWGVTHATHTYNAMRPLHHREAGSVGAVLLTDSIDAELIYDRLHVSTPAARLLIEQKPHEALIGVSDGTMAAGLPAGTELSMWGLDAVVGDSDVRLRDGTLAGSAVTLDEVFRNLWADFGPLVATRACCLNPRRELRMTETKVWQVLDREGRLIDLWRHDS
jgi:N-acetylglucosamine-6-phosphate deacetylase